MTRWIELDGVVNMRDLGGLPTHTLEEQLPRAESMAAVLAHLDDEYGGTIGWLEAAGWTQEEVARLRDRLVG